MNKKPAISIAQRIERLRNYLNDNKLSAFIIPSNCEHFGEYVQNHFKSREWISGFTGSAGTVVITADKAALWTDSRYFVQAADELKGSGIDLMKLKMPGTPSIAEWIADNNCKTVGIDGNLFSVSQFASLSQQLSPINLILCSDPFSDEKYDIWPGREPEQFGRVELRGVEVTGESIKSKYNRLTKRIELLHPEIKRFAYIITTCDDIAWLCNIRGNDIEYNPIVESYAVVDEHGINLFANLENSPTITKDLLRKSGVKVDDYHKFREYISNLKDDVIRIYTPDTFSQGDYKRIVKNNAVCLEDRVPGGIIGDMKSVKNECEIEGFKRAFIYDGIAWCKLLKYIDDSVKSKKRLNEYIIGEKLIEFRSDCPDYKGESFEPIVAFGSSAALPHYSASKDSYKEIGENNFLLMDTGAQYNFGTTDTTRTVAIGSLDDEQKKYYTLVLKGMINLSCAKFPLGTRGSQLDILARGPLFNNGAMYYHGTGHGIGHNLCVHEGPQSIRMEENPVTIKSGMVISNEPAIYFENRWGIRIENVIFAKSWLKNEFGEFLEFETLTLVPIDTKAIIPSMLSSSELEWIKTYNTHVYNMLKQYLGSDEQEWLKNIVADTQYLA